MIVLRIFLFRRVYARQLNQYQRSADKQVFLLGADEKGIGFMKAPCDKQRLGTRDQMRH